MVKHSTKIWLIICQLKYILGFQSHNLRAVYEMIMNTLTDSKVTLQPFIRLFLQSDIA